MILRRPNNSCSVPRSYPGGAGMVSAPAAQRPARDFVRSGTTTNSVGTASSEHAGQLPSEEIFDPIWKGNLDDGIAKMPGRCGSPMPMKAALLPGVAAMSVGSAPTGKKLKPGTVGS